MKLYKQTKLKTTIAGLTVGLFGIVFAVVRSDPGILAEPETSLTPTATPAQDFGSFSNQQDRSLPVLPTPTPPTQPSRPHTRTHAS